MDVSEVTPEDLIGPLNETEARYAPAKLYAVGDTTMLLHAPRVSIVGSRDASPEGLARARRLSVLLVKREVVVVSGLAKGIDTAAHTAAVDAHGRTVAVLGTPIDRSYPKENAALQMRLAKEQLVLSQFPPATKTRPYHFPERNRTMALLSDATVIIEAGETSGSLSQGWEALRLGRPLFIAQSVIDNPLLSWPEKMLAYGAIPLSDATLDDLYARLPDREIGVAFAGELPF